MAGHPRAMKGVNDSSHIYIYISTDVDIKTCVNFINIWICENMGFRKYGFWDDKKRTCTFVFWGVL